jgi:elongation factor G
MQFPDPVISMSIEPSSRADRDKLSEALQKIAREDPTFAWYTDDETATDDHLRHGRAAPRDPEEPRDPRLQGGGRGRSAARRLPSDHPARGARRRPHIEAVGRSRPVRRGEDDLLAGSDEKEIAFENDIIGGSIPREYIPSVEYGIKETAKQGGAYRFPYVGIKATLVDGQYHDVDSSDLAFQSAGAIAFRSAVLNNSSSSSRSCRSRCRSPRSTWAT